MLRDFFERIIRLVLTMNAAANGSDAEILTKKRGSEVEREQVTLFSESFDEALCSRLRGFGRRKRLMVFWGVLEVKWC